MEFRYYLSRARLTAEATRLSDSLGWPWSQEIRVSGTHGRIFSHCFSSSPLSVRSVILGGLEQEGFTNSFTVVAALHFASVQDSKPRCVFYLPLKVHGFYSSSFRVVSQLCLELMEGAALLLPQWKIADSC